MNQPRDLILLTRAEKALLEATSIDEVRDLRDKAAAVKAYAKKAQLGQKAVVHAAVIKLRAERRLGEMLRIIELADSALGNQYTGPVQPDPDLQNRVHLSDLGITKSDSSRSQRIAELPEQEFEKYLADQADSNREPTLAGALRLAKLTTLDSSDPHRCGTPPPASLPTQPPTTAGCCFPTVVAAIPSLCNDVADEHEGPNRRRISARIDVQGLPLKTITDHNAHLHLWTSNDSLRQALAIMESWGFRYRSSLVVLDSRIGPGEYWCESHQLLLLGLRGRLPFRESGHPSWIECELSRNDSVPQAVLSLIQSVSPPPYLAIHCGVASPDPSWIVWPPDDGLDAVTG